MVVPLFGAAYAAPNKGTTILYWFRPPKTVLNPPVNGKNQGLFKACECFSSAFQYSSTFQACANPVHDNELVSPTAAACFTLSLMH